jgi:hypothetical protein
MAPSVVTSCDDSTVARDRPSGKGLFSGFRAISPLEMPLAFIMVAFSGNGFPRIHRQQMLFQMREIFTSGKAFPEKALSVLVLASLPR